MTVETRPRATPPPLPLRVRHRKKLIAAAIVVPIILVLWFVLTSSGLSRQRMWDAQADTVSALVFSPDGKTLISSGDNAIRLWDPATGKLKSSIPTPGSITGLSPGGDILTCYVEHRPSKRTVEYRTDCWDLKTATQLPSIDHLTHSHAFSPDNKILATATNPADGSGHGTIETWSLPSMTRIALYDRPGFVNGLVFSADGKTLASGEGAIIELLDASTGRTFRTLTGTPAGKVGPGHFSPDGKTLTAFHTAPTSNDTSLWTYDLSTGQAQLKFRFEHAIHGAAFSADGRILAVRATWYVFGRSDRVEVWDTVTGEKIGSVKMNLPFMWSVAVSPDGTQLAIGFQPRPRFKPAPIGIWRIDR